MNANGAIETARKEAPFALLVALALLALASFAFAQTSITSCGTYSANNTAYELNANLTVLNNSTCLAFTGTNQTFNGNWNSISSNSTALYGIVQSSGANLSITKVWINGFENGIRQGTGGSRLLTVSFAIINGSTYGIRIGGTNNSAGWRENVFTSILTSNTTTGFYAASTATTYGTITNCDFSGSTDDINIMAGAGTYTDGGYNFWDDCSGSCAWYSIIKATNETVADTYITNASADTNFRTAGLAPLTTDFKRLLFRSPANFNVNPPARVFVANSSALTLWNNYIFDTNPTAISSYNASFTINDTNLTHNNLPAIGNFSACVGNSSSAPGWKSWACFTQDSFADYVGNNVMITNNDTTSSRDTGTNNFGCAMAENATSNVPYLLTQWWHPWLSAVSTVYYWEGDSYSTTNATGVVYVTNALSLENASRCAHFIPTNYATSFWVTNYVTGAAASTAWTNAYLANSSGQWAVWNCSAGTFYSFYYTVPQFYLTNTSSCASGTATATFSFIDENTRAASAASASASISGTAMGIPLSYTYTMVGTNSTISLCHQNTTTSFSINVDLIYSNSTSNPRDYYLSANESTSTNITAFLLNTTYSSFINFKTKNQYGQPLPGRIQHYLRYFPANASYVLVAMGMTDSDGQYAANIYTNGSTFYRIESFLPNWSTSTEKTFSRESVYCLIGQMCDYDLIISSTQPLPTWWTDFYNNVQYNCSTNISAKTIVCAYVDGSGSSHTYNLTAWRIGFGNPVQVCSQQTAGASGTLLCTISDANLTGNVYSWRLMRQSELSIVTQGSLDMRPASDLSIIGLGIAFIVIVICGLIGIYNPAVGVIMAATGVVAAHVLGLFNITVTALAMLVLVALLIAWRAARH